MSWVCRNYDGETVCTSQEEADEMDRIWSYSPHAECGWDEEE